MDFPQQVISDKQTWRCFKIGQPRLEPRKKHSIVYITSTYSHSPILAPTADPSYSQTMERDASVPAQPMPRYSSTTTLTPNVSPSLMALSHRSKYLMLLGYGRSGARMPTKFDAVSQYHRCFSCLCQAGLLHAITKI